MSTGGPGVKGFESFIRVTLGSPKDMKKAGISSYKKERLYKFMNNVLITGAGKGIGFECVKKISLENDTKIFALIRSKSDKAKFKNFKKRKSVCW